MQKSRPQTTHPSMVCGFVCHCGLKAGYGLQKVIGYYAYFTDCASLIAPSPLHSLACSTTKPAAATVTSTPKSGVQVQQPYVPITATTGSRPFSDLEFARHSCAATDAVDRGCTCGACGQQPQAQTPSRFLLVEPFNEHPCSCQVSGMWYACGLATRPARAARVHAGAIHYPVPAWRVDAGQSKHSTMSCYTTHHQA